MSLPLSSLWSKLRNVASPGYKEHKKYNFYVGVMCLAKYISKVGEHPSSHSGIVISFLKG